MDRTFEKHQPHTAPFTYTSSQPKEFGNAPARVFSKAAYTMMVTKDKQYENLKQEIHQEELEKLRKRRKINEDRIKNLSRFVTTFPPVDQFSRVEFDKV